MTSAQGYALADRLCSAYVLGMASYKTDTLTALIRNGYWLRLVCPCGHDARVDPVTLRTELQRKGKSLHLARLDESMKCQQCGGRKFDAAACHAPEGWT